jgi:hypothetical protein
MHADWLVRKDYLHNPVYKNERALELDLMALEELLSTECEFDNTSCEYIQKAAGSYSVERRVE